MPVTPVTITNLGVSLGGVPILRDVSLTVEPHEVVALLGGNGSGKTTLIRALLGLVPHDHGEIALFGTSLDQFHQWSQIGYVPQRASVSMHSTTVRELVSSGTLSTRRPFTRLGRAGRDRVSESSNGSGWPRRPTTRSSISRAASSSVSSSRVPWSPHLSYSSWTSRSPASISPLSNGSPTSSASLRGDGMAVLVVLHETDVFAPLLDRVVVLREGRVAHDGALEAHIDHGHETQPPTRTVRIIEEVRPWK